MDYVVGGDQEVYFGVYWQYQWFVYFQQIMFVFCLLVVDLVLWGGQVVEVFDVLVQVFVLLFLLVVGDLYVQFWFGSVVDVDQGVGGGYCYYYQDYEWYYCLEDFYCGVFVEMCWLLVGGVVVDDY